MPTPLIDAIDRRDLELLRAAATTANRDAAFEEGGGSFSATPLTRALGRGFYEVAQALLELGAELEGRNGDGETTLQAVLWFKEPLPAIEWLLARGAEVNAPVFEPDSRIHDGTALHLAVTVSTPQVVERLLAAGADVHQRDEAGCTPLHLAMEAPESAMVRALLARGASALVSDQEGLTPLHHAVQHFLPFPAEADAPSGDDELRTTVSLLLAAGASIETTDRAGRRAWDLARRQAVPLDVMERLRPSNASTPPRELLLPAALDALFAFLAGAAICTFAQEWGGVAFEGLLLRTKTAPGFLEVGLLAVGLAVLAVLLAVAVDRCSPTPRRLWWYAMAALEVVLLGAIWVGLQTDSGTRLTLTAVAMAQVPMTAFAVGRPLQPDRLALVGSDPR